MSHRSKTRAKPRRKSRVVNLAGKVDPDTGVLRWTPIQEGRHILRSHQRSDSGMGITEYIQRIYPPGTRAYARRCYFMALREERAFNAKATD